MAAVYASAVDDELGGPFSKRARLNATRRRQSLSPSEVAIPPALWMVTANEKYEPNVAIGILTTEGLRGFLTLAQSGALPQDKVRSGSKLMISWAAVDALRPPNAHDDPEKWPYINLQYSYPDVHAVPYSPREPATLWKIGFAGGRVVPKTLTANDVIRDLLAQEQQLRTAIQQRQADADATFYALNADTRGVVSSYLPYHHHRRRSGRG